MNTDVDVPLTGQDRQEAFWTWVEQTVKQLVVAVPERAGQ